MAHKKNSGRESRSRRWTITLNNYTEEELDVLSSLNTVYMIYGRETAPTTGTPHIQGFCIFNHGVRRSTLEKKIPRAHWEEARETTRKNIEYCMKEDKSPYIKGSVPLERSKANLDAEAIMTSNPVNGNRILANNRQIEGMRLEKKMLLEISKDKLKKPKIVYIHGSSGSGKSYFALRRAIMDYGIEQVATIRFDRSGFAHCSNPLAKCLVFMEFRPSCIDAVTFLELTDGYGVHLNVKHGSIYIRPKCLYICSIMPPTEIYKEEINRQFLRRITEIINKDNDPYIDRTEDSDEESTIDLASESDFD